MEVSAPLRNERLAELEPAYVIDQLDQQRLYGRYGPCNIGLAFPSLLVAIEANRNLFESSVQKAIYVVLMKEYSTLVKLSHILLVLCFQKQAQQRKVHLAR